MPKLGKTSAGYPTLWKGHTVGCPGVAMQWKSLKG